MQDAAAIQAERDMLTGRHAELTALAPSVAEWERLSQTQSRLPHAAPLLESVTAPEAERRDGDAALGSRLAAVVQRLKQAAAHDAALNDVIALCDEARIRTDEASRALRSYRERLDLDPGALARVEARVTAFYDAARKYRVRPRGWRGARPAPSPSGARARKPTLGARCLSSRASYRQNASLPPRNSDIA